MKKRKYTISQHDIDFLIDRIKLDDMEGLSIRIDSLFYKFGLSFDYQLHDYDGYIQVNGLVKNIFGSGEDKYIIIDYDLIKRRIRDIEDLLDRIDKYIEDLKILQQQNNNLLKINLLSFKNK